MAYDRIDPIGKFRDELGWAQISALLYNFAGMIQDLAAAIYGKKGHKALPSESKTAWDFVPKWGQAEEKAEEEEPVKVQSVQDMKKILLRMAHIANRNSKGKGKKK